MRVLLSMASVVIVVAGLKSAGDFFIPVMLGLFLALLSLPILNWLNNRGVPRPLAVLATVAIDLLILFGIVFLASGVIGEFQERSGVYAKKLRAQASEFSESMDHQLERLGNFWSDQDETSDVIPAISPTTPAATDENKDVKVRAGESVTISQPEDGGEITISTSSGDELNVSKGDGAIESLEEDSAFATYNVKEVFDLYFDENRIIGYIGKIDVVSRFTAIASKSFFVLIVMIFVLAESHSYAQKVRAVLRVRGPDLSRFQSTSMDIQKYLAIKTGVSFVTGLLAMISCVIFKVDFPLLWGLVAFLFNYVPAIGSIVAAIPPVLLALILHGFWPAMGVLGCYLVINIVIGNFLEPTLLGGRFGISTVVVILSVLFWGYVWGPVGMLLAVPLTMVVKVMLDNSSDLRWISAIMGKGTVPKPPNPEEEPGPAAATESTPVG